MVKALRLFDHSVDVSKCINIRAYDDMEHLSKGLIILPINVGSTIKDTICQVLDLITPQLSIYPCHASRSIHIPLVYQITL